MSIRLKTIIGIVLIQTIALAIVVWSVASRGLWSWSR